MKITDQIQEANKATEKLLKTILNLNKRNLKKNFQGCRIENIQIEYDTDYTTLYVKYKSDSQECNSFTCSFTEYNY